MKLTLKQLILSSSILLMSLAGDAQRFAGANLSYDCVSNTEYLVRLEIYYNCAISNPSTTETVRVIKSPFNPEVISLNRVGIEEISQICPDDLDQSLCSGGSIQGYFKLTYEGSLNHDGSNDFIRLRWKVGYRMNSDNIDNSGLVDQYAHAVIYPQNDPCNTSPRLSVETIPTFCSGEDVTYNMGLYTPESEDSLRFSFTDALVPDGAWNFMSAPYETGFVSDPPIPGATIDPHNGTIAFNSPSPGIYTVSILLEEYDDNGLLIGEQIFDQLFYIQNCSTPPPSSLSSTFTLESGTATVLANDSLRMCYGDDFCVSYDFSSSAGGAELTVETNVDEIIPGAVVTTTGTNPLNVEICWTANPDFNQGPISVLVSDNICSVNGIAQETFYFEIIPGVYAGEDAFFCPGQSVQLEASGSTTYTWTSISGDPVSLFDCTNCSDPTFLPTQPSIFQVEGGSAGNGCSTIDQVAVNPSLNYSLNITGTGCDGDDGEIELTITSGSGDYSLDFNGEIIEIENGSFDTTGLVLGTYPISLFDDILLCNTSFDVEIEFGVEIPDPEILPPSQICGLQITLDGSVDNTDVLWSGNGPGTVSFDSNTIEDPTITVSSEGSYWIYLNETHDISGCSASDSILLDFLIPEQVIAGVDTSVCSFSYLMPGSAANGTWQWFPLGPGSVSYTTDSADPATTVTVSNLGNYDFLWTFSGDNGCDTSGTVAIEFVSTPLAESADTLTFCQLEDNFLSATAAGSGEDGEWSFPSGSFSGVNFIDPNSPIDNDGGFGEFLAIWTVSNDGCSDADTTILRYLAPEDAEITTIINQVCGNSVDFSAANSSGTWSSSDPDISFSSADQPNTTVSSASAGGTTITWTVGEGVCADSESWNLAFFDSAQVDIGTLPVEICSSDQIALLGSVSNAISFQWSSNGDGDFDDVNSLPTTYSPGLNDSINGSVTITLSADGESVCPVVESSAIVDIIGQPSVIADASSPTSICSDGSVILDGNQENTSSTEWMTAGDGTFSNTGEDPTYFPGLLDIQNGTVTLTYTGQPNSAVCPIAEESIDITITEAPVAGIDSMISICESSDPLDVLSLFGSEADSGGNLIDVDGSGALVGSAFSPETAGQGTFTFTYNVIGTAPCTDALATATIEVTNGANSGDGSSVSTCDNGVSIDLFSELSGSPQIDGVWVDIDGSGGLNIDQFDPSTSGSGEYTLIYVTSLAGCENDTATVTVSVGGLPTVQAGADMISICETEDLELSALVSGQDSLQWTSTGNGVFGADQSEITDYAFGSDDISNGSVTLNLTAFGPIGCPSAEDEVLVNIGTAADAGADNGASLCISSSALDLNTLLSAGTDPGGNWTDVDASGGLSGNIFDPSVVSISTYEFDYTVMGGGICPDSTSTMTIYVSSAAFAGDDATASLCESTNELTLIDLLNGTPQIGGEWVGITSSNGLTDGILDVQELSAGDYTYEYTVEIADCSSSDVATLILTIDAAPEADITLSTATICESDILSPTGFVSNEDAVLWSSTGDGVFAPDNLILSEYTPGANDIIDGQVTLFLTALTSNSCPNSIDSLELNIVQTPVADIIATTLETCGQESQLIESTALNSTTISWITTDGDGSFDDSSIEDPTYSPGVQDLIDGFATLVMTVQGNSACPDSTDQLVLDITSPTQAGEDQSITICQTGQAIDLTDELDVDADTGGNWTDVDGSGALSGSDFDPNLASIGEFDISYVVDGQGSCAADEAVITVVVSEGANAGLDASTSVCASLTEVELFSELGGSPDSGGDWEDLSSSGALTGGVFDPSLAGVGIFDFEYEVSLAGCSSDSSSVTIEVTPSPSISIDNLDLDICSGESFDLESTATNASSTEWSSTGSGDFSSIASEDATYEPSETDIENGSVELTITAQGSPGCTSAESSILLNIIETPLADAGADLGGCGLQNQLNAILSSGDGEWSGPAELDFSDNDSPTSDITSSAYGSFLVTWTEQNQGCADDDVMTIEFWDSPDTVNTSISCVNTNTQFEVTINIINGDEASYQIDGAGTLLGSVFTSEPLNTGDNYSFTLTDINDCAPLIIEGQFTCPSLTNAGSMELDTIHACVGETVTAIYNEDAFLDSDDIQQFILHDSPSGIGTVLAISTDPTFEFQEDIILEVVYYISSIAGNDDGTGNVAINGPGFSVSNPTPTIFHAAPTGLIISEDVSFCEGGFESLEIELGGNGPFELTYEFLGEEFDTILIGPTAFINVDEGGMLDLIELTDSYCSSTLDLSAQVTEFSLPTLDVEGEFTTCSDDPGSFDVLFTGTGPWNYSLSISGADQGIQISQSAQAAITPNISGEYILYNVSDENCLNTIGDTIQVSILDTPVAEAGADLSICTGDSIMIGSAGQLGVSYQWTNPGSLIDQFASSTTAFPSNVGSTPVEQVFQLTSSLGICSSTDEMIITVNPAPISFGIEAPDAICLGDSIQISAFGGSTYQWESDSTLSDTSVSSPLVFPNQVTQYQVTIYNQYECSVSTQTSIAVNPLPQPIVSFDIIESCLPATVLVFNETAISEYTGCEWIYSDGVVVQDDCSLLELDLLENGEYYTSIRLVNEFGCEALAAVDTIIVQDAEAAFSFFPAVPTADDEFIQVFDASESAILHTWSIDGDSLGDGPTAMLPLEGLRPDYYDVCLAILTEDGCIDTLCKRFELQNNVTVWIPNTFTPDADNINDVFIPVINGVEYIEEYQLKIFNRKGQVTFESGEWNLGWDGAQKNEKISMQGMYQWEITMRVFGEPTLRQYHGSVTLLK